MILYPPEGGAVTFEQMDAAALESMRNPKNYPSVYVSGTANVMREVYASRIFAFAFVTKHPKKQTVFGGAISRTGVSIVRKEHIDHYYWKDIEKLTVHATYKDYGSTTTMARFTGWYYIVEFKFGPNNFFNFDPDNTRFPDIPQNRQSRSNHVDTAEMCAFYYNRVRAESMQKFIYKGDKRVYLHHDLDQNYAAEMVRRFHSPEGIQLKWMRQRVFITHQGVITRKGKRKIIQEIRWADVQEMILGLGSKKALIMLIMKPGIDPPRKFFNPRGWKLDPDYPDPTKLQGMNILPLCWMEL